MICNKCHVQVEEGTTVCPVCGAPIEPEVVVEQEVAAVEAEAANVFSVEEIADPEENETAMEELQEEENSVPAQKKTWVKVTAIAVCVALVLGLASMVWYWANGGWKPRTNDLFYKDQYYAKEEKAVKAADDVIATVGGKELTNGQFQVFYWMNVYEFYQQYGNYLSYLGLDVTKPLSEQLIDEKSGTWEQFFIDSALNAWHNYQSMLLLAEKEGYVRSDELTQQLEAMVDTMEASAAQYGLSGADEMVQMDMGPSTSLDDYMHYLNVYYSGMEYVDSLYEKMTPTDAEIDAYYEANADTLKTTYSVDKESGKLIDVRHILIMPKGGTEDENGEVTYSQEEWDTCLLEAESLLKQWQEGEATEESFSLLASEATEDPGSQATGGLYEYVYEGQMVPEFNDWCFDESRQYGDTGIVKTSYGYHIMFFVYGEEGWIRRAKEALITDACSEIMEKAMEEYPMEVNYKKIVLGKADMAG